MGLPLVVIFVVAWVVTGLMTGLWMIRRGHDRRWAIIAIILGPLFTPAALEKVERLPRLAVAGPEEVPARNSERSSKPHMLIGLDGSPQAEQTLLTTLELFGPSCGTLTLTEVVDYDATDDDDPPTAIDTATKRLAAAAELVGDRVPVRFQVLAGPPGEALCHFAKQQDMDLVVVGRRGRGLSARLLGSVSAHVVQHSSVPVLVIEPTPAALSSTATGAVSDHDSSESPLRPGDLLG